MRSAETAVFKDAFSALSANSVGYFSDLVVLFDAVAVLAAVLERYAVDDEMIVQVVCVQVCGDDHLEAVAPHPARRFDPDLIDQVMKAL